MDMYDHEFGDLFSSAAATIFFLKYSFSLVDSLCHTCFMV